MKASIICMGTFVNKVEWELSQIPRVDDLLRIDTNPDNPVSELFQVTHIIWELMMDPPVVTIHVTDEVPEWKSANQDDN